MCKHEGLQSHVCKVLDTKVGWGHPTAKSLILLLRSIVCLYAPNLVSGGLLACFCVSSPFHLSPVISDNF